MLPSPTTSGADRSRAWSGRSVFSHRAIVHLMAQLQGGQAQQDQHHGDDPEPHDDARLRPALEFEVVVNRRHAEDALAGQLEAEATCRMTDTVSSTKMPPMMKNTISCRVITATVPSAAPSASAPTSPMNTCAG